MDEKYDNTEASKTAYLRDTESAEQVTDKDTEYSNCAKQIQVRGDFGLWEFTHFPLRAQTFKSRSQLLRFWIQA